MPNDPTTFWTALPSIGSLLAVVVALSLAVVPAIWRRIHAKAHAKRSVKANYAHINRYLENYRFHCTTIVHIGKEVYRQFGPSELKLDLQVNPAHLLDKMADDVRLIGNKQLSAIFQTSTSIFSGWPEKLSLWYELEAQICLHFGFDCTGKQFAPHEIDAAGADNPAPTGIKMYSCLACVDDYPPDAELQPAANVSIAKVFQTPVCPRHGLPLQIVFR